MGHPRLAVDGLLLLDGKLVCVIRGQPPFQGMHALPGGAVELGETTEAAMAREMEEETGLKVSVAGLVGVYSEPGRDPRGHTISIAYEVRRLGGRLTAGSDAAALDLVDPANLPTMAFDHARIVADFLKVGAPPSRALPRASSRSPSPSRESTRQGPGEPKRVQKERGRRPSPEKRRGSTRARRRIPPIDRRGRRGPPRGPRDSRRRDSSKSGRRTRPQERPQK